MTQWLAVVAMCAAGECAFWANTTEPLPSQEICVREVIQAEAHFRKQGVDLAFSTCLPIKWGKGKVAMEQTWKQ
jgi:hypothetical protein